MSEEAAPAASADIPTTVSGGHLNASSGATPTSSTETAAAVERELRAQLAAITGGLAPDVYTNAWWDWYLNLAQDPPQQLALWRDAFDKTIDTMNFAARAASGTPTAPETTDPRFANDAWSQWPFNVFARGYANYAEWWHKAATSAAGISAEHARTLNFSVGNALDAVSPSNFLASNPELLNTTRAQAGQNLVRGFEYYLEDLQRTLGGEAAEKSSSTDAHFVVGRDIAATPGKVVFRNELIELIQYAPSTSTVFAEPILIVPAWIMKYYILDLSPHNSLVHYLVSRGHSVFILSWKNPNASDSALGMDDYLRLGVDAAVDAVSAIVPGAPIHSVGYCIGGTLLSIAAARYAGQHRTVLGTLTLLAAQQDFSEPGELSVFISPSQIDMLESVMQRTGVLKSEQMAAAFTLLRSRDLLWGPAVKHYLRGEREKPNDLMAWNADGTRMPYRMHAEYLRQLYLNNALARGEFCALGQRVELARIEQPMFVVGTETDHVAPWASVYKARALTRSSDYTFLLTSGGHNAGIVSGPAHPRRRHRVLTWHDTQTQPTSTQWLEAAPSVPGSWWPVWQAWLANHSSATQVPPPPMGAADAGYAPLADAPGEYVLQR